MSPLRAVAPAATATQCRYCPEELPPGARQCPLCLRPVEEELRAAAPQSRALAGRSNDTSQIPADDVYEIPALETEIPAEWQSIATYTLELPARCPHCREPIRTVRVLGLTRTHVSFISTLPRRGRVIVCPECERIVSAELSGLV